MAETEVETKKRKKTETETETETETKKRKKTKEAFIYGNYKNYYGYRIDRDQEEDPRLAAFKREWFEGKDCLDVGCNQGLITINIAKKFHCRSILGVDIDAGLIDAAHWNLRKFARMMKASKALVSDSTDCSANNICIGSNEKTYNTACSPSEEDIFGRVSFMKENFVASSHGCSEKYDAILWAEYSSWNLNLGPRTTETDKCLRLQL